MDQLPEHPIKYVTPKVSAWSDPAYCPFRDGVIMTVVQMDGPDRYVFDARCFEAALNGPAFVTDYHRGWHASYFEDVPGTLVDAPIPNMNNPQTSSPVVRPEHYTQYKIEPIYFIRENQLPFWMGNVIKYVMRAEKKNGLEDLKKARRYLDMEIARQEGVQDWAN